MKLNLLSQSDQVTLEVKGGLWEIVVRENEQSANQGHHAPLIEQTHSVCV